MTPRRLSRFIVRPASTVRYDLRLVSFSDAPVTERAFALPEESRGDVPDWGQPPSSAAGVEFVLLAPGLWSVEIEPADARVLVIERTGDLVLLGAPDGDAVCSSLVAALRDRFPGKPIALAAFGHHHPSPSGGLRALAAAGATIIAPHGLESHVRELLSRPTSLGPPAVTAPRQPRLELFDRETVIDCGEICVRLIDIAEPSAHAFHYVVFYFPASGILFEDDLGYFPENGAARVGPRLIGLVDALDALDALHIEPTRLIQLWPVRNVLREVRWEVVAEMVMAARDRQKTK